MTVYIDRVFVLNLLVDYLLLLAAARLAGAPLRRLRFALCACLGGGYAVAVLLPGLSVLGAWWCRAAVGLGMALLAFRRERSCLRLTALFFLLSGALAGLILAAGLALGTSRQLPGRLWQARIDWKLLLGGTALLSAVLELLFHQGARHGGGERMTVTVALNGRTKEICALHDTGNTLRNPMDGQGVLVMERGALLSPLPPWERTLLREGLAPEETMARLYQGETRLHFTLLPYRAVGTASGLLLAVRSDYIAFGRRRYPRALIALSPGPVSDGGGYCALWGGEEGGEGVDRASARAAASAASDQQAG